MDSKQIKNLIDHIILYSDITSDKGLFYGKTGIALTLFEYSRFINNDSFEELALEILQEDIESVLDTPNPNFESGLSGLGWTILYLIHNDFLDKSSEIILSKIDKTIIKWNIIRFKDISFKKGLKGISFYIWSRIYFNKIYSSNKKLFDKDYLVDWERYFKNFFKNNKLSNLSNNCEIWRSFVFPGKKFFNPLNIQLLLSKVEKNYSKGSLLSYHMGLNEGLSGKVLYYIING